jgi:hypothetical protein
MRNKTDDELTKELKRISRKARRFSSRNKFLKKSVFPIDLGKHPGVSLT